MEPGSEPRLKKAAHPGPDEAWLKHHVAGLIALEKTLPWRRVATYATTAILCVLGLLLLVAPEVVPALTIPGGPMAPMMG